MAGGQAELARRVSKEMRRPIDRSIINKMIRGRREVPADEMLAIEAASGLAAPSPHLPTLLPLVDWVAAGSLSEPSSQVPESDVPRVAFVDLPRGDYIALTVKGTSMDRLCPEGSVIAVNRTDKALVAGKPYIFAVRGLTNFKLWHADPPYLDPHSWDPSHKPTFVKKKRDLEVVGRVVRSILDLQ